MITMNKLAKYIANIRYGKLGNVTAKPVRYILRPSDGVQTAMFLPTEDPAAGKVFWTSGRDEVGKLYIAVCDFCGGNCGQCGTSVGQGIPFDFELMAKNGKWDQPGWGIHRRDR